MNLRCDELFWKQLYHVYIPLVGTKYAWESVCETICNPKNLSMLKTVFKQAELV